MSVELLSLHQNNDNITSHHILYSDSDSLCTNTRERESQSNCYYYYEKPPRIAREREKAMEISSYCVSFFSI